MKEEFDSLSITALTTSVFENLSEEPFWTKSVSESDRASIFAIKNVSGSVTIESTSIYDSKGFRPLIIIPTIDLPQANKTNN